MPDYSGNVSATVKLERDLGLLSFVSSSKHSGLLISEGFFSPLPFLRNAIKQDLCAACKYST